MTVQSDTPFDLVVVGSGVAGALAADRLAARGLRVAVLEAGPRIDRTAVFDATRTSGAWDASAGYPDPALAPRAGGPRTGEILDLDSDGETEVNYLRCVGGTTWHWSGCTPRLLPSDLATRTNFGFGEDWPVTYQELEPYYCEAERELGVSGDNDEDYGTPRSQPFPRPPMPLSTFDRAVAETFAPHGIRMQPMPQPRGLDDYEGRTACHGHNFCTPICPIGAQYSASMHIERAEARGCVISPDTVVTGFATKPDGRVDHVVFRRPDGSTGLVRGRAFVLAANGLESPRLLLASRSDANPEGMANRSGGVGTHLMGHTEVHFTMRMARSVYPGRGPLSLSLSSSMRDGTFRRTSAGGLIVLDNNLLLRNIVVDLLGAGMMGQELDRKIREEAARRFRMIFIAEERPLPENRLTLDWAKRDQAGIPAMRIRLRSDPYSIAGADRFAAVIDRLAGTAALERIGRRESLLGTHLMGTLRMGEDPRSSVVSAQAQSHEHRNLYVAGSSVFPTGGTANPTLTIAALSLRMADRILQDLGSGL